MKKKNVNKNGRKNNRKMRMIYCTTINGVPVSTRRGYDNWFRHGDEPKKKNPEDYEINRWSYIWYGDDGFFVA